MKKQFRSFKEARKYVQKLGLNGRDAYANWTKIKSRPNDIPVSPQRTYNDEWTSWGDFLGTGTIATFDRKFRSFKEARKFIRGSDICTTSDWITFRKSKKFPKDLPKNPAQVYRNRGWKGYGDFCGTDYVATQKRKYSSIANAKKYVQKFRIKGQYAWAIWLKTNKLPKDIPNDPGSFYRKQGTWKGWGDFLGTGNIAPINKKFCSFSLAKKFARKSGMKSQTQWSKYCKSGKKPDEIPMAVQTIYKKEWKGWGDFLGTGNLSMKELSNQFLSITEAKIEARKIAKELGIKTRDDWDKAHKAGKIPKNLPFRLSSIYDPKSKRNRKK